MYQEQSISVPGTPTCIEPIPKTYLDARRLSLSRNSNYIFFTHISLELSTDITVPAQRRSAPDTNQTPHAYSPAPPQPFNTLSLLPSLLPPFPCACIGCRFRGTLLPHNTPHRPDDALIRTYVDNSLQVLVSSGGISLGGKNGHLAPPQYGLEGEFEEELQRAGHEPADAVGGGCEDGIDGEAGAQQDGGGVGDGWINEAVEDRGYH
jgi:hypothetical protein